MQVVVDTREQDPFPFVGYDVAVVPGTLQAGDYSIPGLESLVAVERKSLPDPVACGGFHGLYIEMKAQGGRTSDQQKEWIAALQAQGYRVEVCVGADAAWRVICEYLGITQTLRA